MFSQKSIYGLTLRFHSLSEIAQWLKATFLTRRANKQMAHDSCLPAGPT